VSRSESVSEFEPDQAEPDLPACPEEADKETDMKVKVAGHWHWVLPGSS
jgi:hypothetical protein